MRDYQYKSHQWLVRAWARSTPLGPFLVTPDEVGDPHALDITLDLNGERMQEANTRLFIFDIPTIVATISEFTPLAVGDVVLTGTPQGVGYRRDPKVLKDGDRIVVEISGRRAAREHRRRRVNVSITFDNLGEASDLERGWWPRTSRSGTTTPSRGRCRGCSTLDEAGLRATFFVEGLNTELYPETLASWTPPGTRSPCHGWRTSAGARSTLPAASSCSAAWTACARWVCSRRASGRRAGADRLDAGPAARARLRLLLARGGRGDRRPPGAAVPLGAARRLTTTCRTSPTGAARAAAPPARLRETVLEALEGDAGFLALLFHPFLADTEERTAVIRDVLARVRELVDAGRGALRAVPGLVG